jgi:hypothetical protein
MPGKYQRRITGKRNRGKKKKPRKIRITTTLMIKNRFPLLEKYF